MCRFLDCAGPAEVPHLRALRLAALAVELREQDQRDVLVPREVPQRRDRVPDALFAGLAARVTHLVEVVHDHDAHGLSVLRPRRPDRRQHVSDRQPRPVHDFRIHRRHALNEARHLRRHVVGAAALALEVVHRCTTARRHDATRQPVRRHLAGRVNVRHPGTLADGRAVDVQAERRLARARRSANDAHLTGHNPALTERPVERTDSGGVPERQLAAVPPGQRALCVRDGLFDGLAHRGQTTRAQFLGHRQQLRERVALDVVVAVRLCIRRSLREPVSPLDQRAKAGSARHEVRELPRLGAGLDANLHRVELFKPEARLGRDDLERWMIPALGNLAGRGVDRAAPLVRKVRRLADGADLVHGVRVSEDAADEHRFSVHCCHFSFHASPCNDVASSLSIARR